MKKINIHTKKEVSDNTLPKEFVTDFSTKVYVMKNIDFPLSESYWTIISDTFRKIWNDKIGIGGEFYWDEIVSEVYSEFQNRKILISFDRVEKVVNLMLTHIEEVGGFLDID